MIKNLIKLFIVFLFILSCIRCAFYVVYFDDFANLSVLETIRSFLMGVRVDVISLCMIFALPSLCLFLPISYFQKMKIQAFSYALLYVLFSIALIVIMSDFLYFAHVKRHLANEIFMLQNDLDLIFSMLKIHYLTLVFFIIFEIILYFIFKKIINLNIKLDFSLKNFGILFTLMFVFFLGIRNKIIDKPFGIADAFTSNKTASGNLALNGFFSTIKSYKKQKTYRFYDDSEALMEVKKLLKSDEFEFINDNYPLLRKLKKPILSKKYNIVMIILESWSAKYIDSFSHSNLGVTKNFDKIANEGLKFTNFFANGQRSIEGISAIFTGFSTLPYFNHLGSGLELTNFSYIANIAKNDGYHTLGMQSSKANSFRINSVSKIAGFDEFYGAQDIEQKHLKTSDKKPAFGAWDSDMLSFYLQKINSLKEPFLTFSFTASTHFPFISPDKKYEIYPHDENSLFGYLNTLNYADKALGAFMNKAKKQAWFDDTIFIFLADHTMAYEQDELFYKQTKKRLKNRQLEHMKIPLVIYAPKIFKAKNISRICSQVDILPTLSHLLGFKTPISTMSNSCFSNTAKPFVFFKNANTIGYKTENGYMKHNLKNTLENTLDKDSKKQLLSLYQTMAKHIKENKIYP